MTRGFQSTGSEINALRQELVEQVCREASERPQIGFAANSAVAADDWASTLGLPPGRIQVLYNGLNEASLGFSDAENRDPRPPESDGTGSAEEDSTCPEHVSLQAATLAAPRECFAGLVVGGVFRLDPVKDPLLWVEVARRVAERIPKARFLLVGDGPLQDRVQRRIEALRLADRFEMPGLVRDGLANYYKRMDLFLLTSKSESLPNVVIEAQLAGVPVVAPPVGGIEEAFAEPGTGRLCERSEKALAETVIEALNDHAWREHVRARAPEEIRHRFSLGEMLETTKKAYGW